MPGSRATESARFQKQVRESGNQALSEEGELDREGKEG
jgi:hypothetical protein